MESQMERVILVLMACLALAAGSASEAQQVNAALKTEARVKQQLDAAATIEAKRR